MTGQHAKAGRNIILSFDYELFLGRDSGTVQKSLIGPTEKVLSLLKRNRLSAIFFIDTMYLCRLQEMAGIYPAARKDYALISDQLRRMVGEGHEVFIHLHPHWLDANYDPETNRWDLSDHRRYCFSSLTDAEKEAAFHDSCQVLHDILGSRHITLDTYRAGGWCIQPFEEFHPYFREYGIRYECSVIPGKWYASDAHQYDFSKAPDRAIYAFDRDIMVENASGPFTALTISVIDVPRWISYLDNKVNVLFFLLKWPYARPLGDGKTVQSDRSESGDSRQENVKREMASFERSGIFFLFAFMRALKRHEYLHFISHPKVLSGMNLFFTGLFLRLMTRRYRVSTDFRGFASETAAMPRVRQRKGLVTVGMD